MMTIEELIKVIERRNELKAAQKRMDEEVNLIEEQIKNYMDESGEEKVLAGHYSVFYKDVVKNSFDSKAFKNDHMDLYEQYTTASIYKPLKITG